ncbi:hypothetical protein E6P78_31230 [Streptomyces sp. A0958]|uniref:hypothetical protein n=1 Tax=Streptomyces sp. A0958 TaxID=2563101 RepID=UPI00109EA5BF|nr:hypothetical protein [Streptomyces sp. A0958]THA57417.1 hypothetical protein E6P78_31230 [Streptomyces sp. A0958]
MNKDGSSIPDEEWERFLREAEAGTSDAPQEPSARARMVAQRLREETGPPQGRRTHQPPRRGGKGWYVVGLLVVVALFVVALDPGRVTGWFGSDDGDAPLAAESVRPSAPPATEGALERPTLGEPFRGSPAARWADGAAGITLPAARATGWMSKKQVTQALDSSLAFLVNAGLDPGVLRGERPAKAIAVLNPKQAATKAYLASAFDNPSRKNNPLLLFSRFEPSYARLAGDVVKTRGRITYRAGERGAVEVTADVTFVYPLVRAADGSKDVARTVVRREIVMSWDDPTKVITEPGTFSLLSYKVDSANGGCDNDTGYFVPAFDDEGAGSGEGPTVDPYDRSTSMGALTQDRDESECGTYTRT